MERSPFNICKFGHSLIRQRASDGYLSISDMCHAFRRKPIGIVENRTTETYIEALKTKGCTDDAIDVNSQGMWAHPIMAVRIAGELSPFLAVFVIDWVAQYEAKKYAPGTQTAVARLNAFRLKKEAYAELERLGLLTDEVRATYAEYVHRELAAE
jgi:hypothetical protein